MPFAPSLGPEQFSVPAWVRSVAEAKASRTMRAPASLETLPPHPARRSYCIGHACYGRYSRMRRIEDRCAWLAHSSDSRFSNSHVSRILAAEIRASVRWISLVLPQIEGAERRNGASSVCAPAREHCQPCDRPARLTALHCGVIRWWDPSAPPDRQGSLGPDRHPSDATEDFIRGSIVSQEAFSTHLPGTGLRNLRAGRRPHSHPVSPAGRPSSEWGYVRHTDATRQRQALLKVIFEHALQRLTAGSPAYAVGDDKVSRPP